MTKRTLSRLAKIALPAIAVIAILGFLAKNFYWEDIDTLLLDQLSEDLGSTGDGLIVRKVESAFLIPYNYKAIFVTTKSDDEFFKSIDTWDCTPEVISPNSDMTVEVIGTYSLGQQTQSRIVSVGDKRSDMDTSRAYDFRCGHWLLTSRMLFVTYVRIGPSNTLYEVNGKLIKPAVIRIKASK
jgi:hypothetical protein